MRIEHRIIATLALLACLLPPVLTGCGKEPSVIDEKISIPVFLSAGTHSEGVATKMTDTIVQNDDPQTFRGIHNFYVIPFSIAKESNSNAWREVVQASDPCFEDNIQLSGNLQQYDFEGEGPTKGFYSGGSFVYTMTNAVLVYGEATEDTETVELGSLASRQRNGVIVPNPQVKGRTSGATAGDLSFNLQPFLKQEEDAKLDADYIKWLDANLKMLTAIADAELESGKFKESSSLKTIFETFTGSVFSVASEGAILTRLYNSCKAVQSSAAADADTKALAKQVCTVIDGYAAGTSPMLAVSEADGSYTVTLQRSAFAEFGLPDGAVALQWGEWKVGSSASSFGSPDKSEGVNLADINDYCFPPALWYYVNSPLLGNSIGGMADQFNNRKDYPKWSDIVNSKTKDNVSIYTRGVSLDTKAALVRDPLQYAVAMLQLSLNGPKTAGAKSLKDHADVDIPIEGKSLPLTGVIIGGQRTQKFDFTSTDKDMQFVYDADVNDDKGAAKAWISSSETSAPIYTLAFTTREKENIHFALEFRNDSDRTITGVRGCTILPGSKFYLIGEMTYSAGTTTNSTKPASVFVKDHITTLKVNFGALAAAYAILPELTSPDLQMGVSAKLAWDLVTPYSAELR